MGQRGLLDRLPVAHSTSVTSFDWCNLPLAIPGQAAADSASTGLGWLVSGGLDRTVKVWDLTAPGASARMPSKPTYTLHPPFPVRSVMWRPGYQCELTVVANAEFGTADVGQSLNVKGGTDGTDAVGAESGKGGAEVDAQATSTRYYDSVQIWDVRRAWIPKWSIVGMEDGVTGAWSFSIYRLPVLNVHFFSDLAFGDSDVIWTQHSSGTFSQIDLRDCMKPLDTVICKAVTWEASGSLAFVTERENPWQIPYDDV
jgi:WD repeat-containing protein 24